MICHGRPCNQSESQPCKTTRSRTSSTQIEQFWATCSTTSSLQSESLSDDEGHLDTNKSCTSDTEEATATREATATSKTTTSANNNTNTTAEKTTATAKAAATAMAGTAKATAAISRQLPEGSSYRVDHAETNFLAMSPTSTGSSRTASTRLPSSSPTQRTVAKPLSHYVPPEEDDYDPRKPEYIQEASPEEVEKNRKDLAARQISQLESRAQKAPFRLRRFYRRKMKEMEDEVPGCLEGQKPKKASATAWQTRLALGLAPLLLGTSIVVFGAKARSLSGCSPFGTR
mmetsp:Transcript_85879/g.188612  ORF Transcript_85879/g.188612 Transcript_85879/m.188612 type:complete len:287 (-) Transcript_85879:28-888(-)